MEEKYSYPFPLFFSFLSGVCKKTMHIIYSSHLRVCDEQKATFITTSELYDFSVMSFTLINDKLIRHLNESHLHLDIDEQ